MPLPVLGSDNRTVIPAAWLQGRTAYGGASAALALIVAKRLAADMPPLRSAQIAFVGPLSGDVAITAAIIRQGKSSVWVEASIAGDDGVGLRALFLFMRPRVSTIAHDDLAMPDVPPPILRDVPPGVPAFIHNFAVADCAAPVAGFRRWARFAAERPVDAEVELLAIADLLPPAALALATTIGPVSSATSQLNLTGRAVAPPDGWFLLEAVTQDAAAGASSQAMRVWTGDGTPAATGTQSVALFM